MTRRWTCPHVTGHHAAMITRIAALFRRSSAIPCEADGNGHAPFADVVEGLDADPYLMVADPDLRLISVFDDLRYDRADPDMMSAPMLRRALSRLEPMGFVQRSGLVIESRAEDTRIHIPKFRALGASPFDALRDTPLRPQDYALLTPTQAAARIISEQPLQRALPRLEALVAKHPVNLLRLHDYLEACPRHEAIEPVIGHLVLIQREAVRNEPLKTRRALR